MPGSSYQRPVDKNNISFPFRPSVIRGPWLIYVLMFLWTNLFSFCRQWMWSYALFIWTAVWKMIFPLMISRKKAAHPTFTFCIALVTMTFFIPNKSHQLLKSRAVDSCGCVLGVSEHPRNLGVQKARGWCPKFAPGLNIKIGIVQKVYEWSNCPFAKTIIWWGNPFGKRTAWSLTYFLNYAYFDI